MTLISKKGKELQIAYGLSKMQKIEYHIKQAKKGIDVKDNLKYALQILSLDCMSFYDHEANPYEK